MILLISLSHSVPLEAIGACVIYEFGQLVYSPLNQTLCQNSNGRFHSTACFVRYAQTMVFVQGPRDQASCKIFSGKAGYRFYGTGISSHVQSTGRCLQSQDFQWYQAKKQYQNQRSCAGANLKWQKNCCLLKGTWMWLSNISSRQDCLSLGPEKTVYYGQ